MTEVESFPSDRSCTRRFSYDKIIPRRGCIPESSGCARSLPNTFWRQNFGGGLSSPSFVDEGVGPEGMIKKLKSQKKLLIKEIKHLRTEVQTERATHLVSRLDSLLTKRTLSTSASSFNTWRRFSVYQCIAQRVQTAKDEIQTEAQQWLITQQKEAKEREAERQKMRQELADASATCASLRSHRDELARAVVKQEEQLLLCKAESKRALDLCKIDNELLRQELKEVRDQLAQVKFPDWVPDHKHADCMLCSKSFSVFVRRHHCRKCGRLVCSQCSSKRLTFPTLGLKNIRACSKCFDSVVRVNSSVCVPSELPSGSFSSYV
eukprot:GILK01010061.1.p1 GENE.GILK01010061.1~~GILK01010061.1.p1  ORF type:complete len:354 (-),score=22.00 GILK01010061.1:100-1062(-)